MVSCLSFEPSLSLSHSLLVSLSFLVLCPSIPYHALLNPFNPLQVSVVLEHDCKCFLFYFLSGETHRGTPDTQRDRDGSKCARVCVYVSGDTLRYRRLCCHYAIYLTVTHLLYLPMLIAVDKQRGHVSHRTAGKAVMRPPVKQHLNEPDIVHVRESSPGSGHQHFLIRLSISKIACL